MLLETLRPHLCAIGLVLGVSSSIVAQSPTTESPALTPVGKEAYEVLIGFLDYDRTLPLEWQIVEKKETDDRLYEKFILRGVYGRMVPGNLELPKQVEAPAPLILLLHGWSGGRDRWWHDGNYYSGGELRKALLDAGFAVLAIDAPAHGERMAENDYALVNDLSGEDAPTHHSFFTVNDIVFQGTRDCRRALDFACERKEIDSGRIGVLGYSMGGWQTFMLAAVEPRIKVAVACVTPSLAGQATPIAPKDYARGIGERPFLMLMGRDDDMCLPQHANQLLDLIPSSKKDLRWFAAGHRLPADYVPHAVSWFKENLP